MQTLANIGLLISGIRGLMYLDAFVHNEVIPNIAIVMGSDSLEIRSRYPETFWEKYRKFFDIDKNLAYYKSRFSLLDIQVNNPDINSSDLKKIILKREELFFIFSGGGIIKPELLNIGKRFIHIHSGILPEYRGSTCFYYSILKENLAGATAFFMQSKLDLGDMIAKKIFNIPKIEESDWFFFDLIFDPWIRAQLLYEVIKLYKEKETFCFEPQDQSKGATYFIIHPLLKNLAIRKCVRKKEEKLFTIN
jgi:methionyl-tRNA formyltransferase